MKKGLVILISLSLIFLLSMSVVSASLFGDFWKKITGKTTENDTTNQTCIDDCPSNGAKQCSGAGYQTCGNYDSDSCLEFSSVTSCSSGETCVAGACVSNTYVCTDSDGGKTYSTKGNVVASSPTSSIDVTDLCSDSNKLVEYFCTSDKQQSGETYTCPNGCSNGACISATTTNQTNTTTTTNQNNVCTDSDGGKNYNVKGNVVASSPTPGYTGNVYDYCKTDGTNALAEYFCDGSTNLMTAQHHVCPNGCSNGACIPSTTSSTTNQTNATTTSNTITQSNTATPTISTTTNTRTTTTPTSSGSGGSGSSSGVLEETISTKEEIIEDIKFIEEVKKIVYSQGNEIKIEIKSEINEDGSSVVREKRTFINKNGEEVKIEIETEVKADGSVILKRKI